MPRVASAGSASTSGPGAANTPQSLKRNQACHQCRKRKLKCNAQKPCATCAKSHRLAVAANPTLAGTEPECTFDEFTPENPPPPPEGPRAKYQRLENRINELESLLKEQPSKEASAGALPSQTSASPSADLLPSTATENINSELSGFISPSHSPLSGLNSNDKSNPFLPTSPPEGLGVNGPSNAGPLVFGEWPRRFPQPDLLHHLIDVFFNCYPHAHYLLHRPTFMASLTFSPRSPAFPHASLLHSICAYASVFSPRVETPRTNPIDTMFPHMNPGFKIEDSFAEDHVKWSRQARDEATSMGSNLVECTQSLVVMVGYYHLQGRWVELWASAGLALRYCVPLGLNNRAGFHTARTHPKTWLRNGGRSILPEAENAIERETRVNLFWIAYSYERFQTAPGPWAMSLDDEDISQVFPAKLEDFETGNDVEQNRQTMQTNQFLSLHPAETTDSFVLYIKASVLLSKVKILSLRVGHRYPNVKDVRETPAFRHLESTIAVFRSTFPPAFQEPVTQTARGFDTQLYVAHLIPHVAIILMHEEHAQMDSPNCLSTQKSLLAARAILDLVYIICSTSYDITRLPPVVTFGWLMGSRVLTRVLKHKYQAGLRAEATMLRSEVEVIRLAFLRMSERIPLALRHMKMVDDLLATELVDFDESVYGTCSYDNIYDPEFAREGGAYDFPAGATLVEVTSQESSATTSSHMPTPDLGILPDVVTDMGPILTDIPTSASATLEQLLQSMDSDSFLLAGGYGDISQIPLF